MRTTLFSFNFFTKIFLYDRIIHSIDNLFLLFTYRHWKHLSLTGKESIIKEQKI